MNCNGYQLVQKHAYGRYRARCNFSSIFLMDISTYGSPSPSKLQIHRIAHAKCILDPAFGGTRLRPKWMIFSTPMSTTTSIFHSAYVYQRTNLKEVRIFLALTLNWTTLSVSTYYRVCYSWKNCPWTAFLRWYSYLNQRCIDALHVCRGILLISHIPRTDTRPDKEKSFQFRFLLLF